MGNEGSMPQGEEEFESQARAPPSATLPRGVVVDQQQQQQQQQSLPSRSNGSSGHRMMNAMFHRRPKDGGGAGIAAVPGAPPMQLEDMIMMSPEQQQQYYQEQQELFLQQQQSYNGAAAAAAAYTNGVVDYGGPPPPPPPAAASAANVSATGTPGAGTPSKKGMSFRPTGRAGAAIINSMKNLSLASSVLGRSNNNNNSPSKPQAASAKDWETKWDEDDDDSDEEENERRQQQHLATSAAIAMSGGPAKPQPAASPQHPSSAQQNGHYTPNQQQQQQYNHQQLQHAQHVAATMPPMIRPGMDIGMSSPSPGTMMPMPISMDIAITTTTPTKAHLVTATPEQPSGVEDGVEWDTGAGASAQPGDDDYEKPNVQMFLPLLRVLGKGSFGKVVLVQKRVGKERGQLFAMKILRKSHLVRRRQIERTRTERKVLSVVNHPFIMKLHYAFQTPDKLYLVLDYCPGGELFFHLSRFRRFPERVARFYAAELLLALGHLHKRGIIYRDLKPENVLLDAEGHVKLGDFGLAKAGIQHACEGATSMCGTPEYMAPEVLAQQGHGFCVDYWGLGMLVYEMMTGLPPWYTTDRTRLFRRLRSAPLDIPTYFSQSSAACVSALLERNPRRRLGVTGIRAAMEHEFFRSISWRALYGRRVEAPIRPCEGWNPPSATSPNAASSNAQMQGDHPELDAATANFDNTFTRMPVETDDHPEGGNNSDGEDMEELHEDTFVGFTFDDNDREEMAAIQQQQLQSRQRTHHLETGDAPPPQTTTGPARHLD